MKIYLEVNKNLYSDLFKNKYFVTHKNRIKAVANLLKGVAKSKNKLLDIGCGDGKITDFIKKTANSNLELYGIELVGKNVEKARARGINAKQCDISQGKIPYDKSFFDIVYAGEVLEHIYDTDGLMSEINRVMKPNGILIITVPNIACWYNRIYLSLGFSPLWVDSGSEKFYGNPAGAICGHIKAFTKKSTRELVANHNFVIKKTKGSSIYPFDNKWINSGLRKKIVQFFYLFELFFAIFPSLATHIIIVARKK
jgi:methionine biosynthesis protein MetW